MVCFVLQSILRLFHFERKFSIFAFRHIDIARLLKCTYWFCVYVHVRAFVSFHSFHNKMLSIYLKVKNIVREKKNNKWKESNDRLCLPACLLACLHLSIYVCLWKWKSIKINIKYYFCLCALSVCVSVYELKKQRWRGKKRMSK